MTGKKALYVTTVSGFIPQFEMNSVEILSENGYELHYASNFNNVFYGKDNSRLDGTGIICHQIDFARSPYSAQTFRAYRQLDRLMGQIDFDVVHCHTPLAGILARKAAKKHKIKTVVYTAHGFHFYRGASFVNRAFYRSAERAMAKNTDALITINEEDYANAKKFKFKKGGRAYKICGVGIDTEKFRAETDVSAKRREIGVDGDDFVVLSVGEINKNKNHRIVIRALENIDRRGIKYLICGHGAYEEELKKLVSDKHMDDCVNFLGYRSDIPEIYRSADLFAFPSYREGLPVSLMEAMAAGLPALASRVRGNVDLIEKGKNGYLLDPDDPFMWADFILTMKKHPRRRAEMGKNNIEKISGYDKASAKAMLFEIYKEAGLFE